RDQSPNRTRHYHVRSLNQSLQDFSALFLLLPKMSYFKLLSKTPMYVERMKIAKLAFVTLSCIFRYGRDDMDVMGISFRRELYMSTRQVYPPLQDRDKGVHTRMQAKLLRKLGDNAYPFFFEFPDNLPCSVALQPSTSDVGKQCAVEFEIKVFSAESQDAKIRKRSTVKLMLRKVQYAPEGEGVAPSVETTRDFVMSDKPLHVKASLDKEIYYHGETLKVHVIVTNNSSKNIKNIIISVDQVANVVLYSNDSYVKCVAIEEPGDSVAPGATLQKVYKLLPVLANNRERRGIALDGKLKHEDTNLASSSIVKEGVLKEVMGIMVSYRVMVKLIVGGEVGLEVPFKLMHPKPDAGKRLHLMNNIIYSTITTLRIHLSINNRWKRVKLNLNLLVFPVFFIAANSEGEVRWFSKQKVNKMILRGSISPE
uniref:S-arrestin n=1 Tax=Dicentrarchus labrax TaxID=13489 RepID=A0A8C4HLP4_DICLA